MVAVNPADFERSYQLYAYLCACLAFVEQRNGRGVAKAIGTQLGDPELRRIAAILLNQGLTAAEKRIEFQNLRRGRIHQITTGEAVTRLENLRRNLAAAYQDFALDYNRVLAPEDILTALQKLVELAPEERQALGLPGGDGLTLLQRSLLLLQTSGGLDDHEMVLRFYKAVVGLDITASESPLLTLQAVDDWITNKVEQLLSFLPEQRSRPANLRYGRSREETVRSLTVKVQREVRRLLARSGNQKLAGSQEEIVNAYVRQYLQPAFITKLTQSLISNERLTDQWPVYLKRVSLLPSGPLPFADRALDILPQAGPYPPLLNQPLSNLDQPAQSLVNLHNPGDYELASQEATQVVVEFYVKVPKDYQPALPGVFNRLGSQTDRDQSLRRIDFSLGSTGIGGSLSHIIKVINRALLQDIPALRDYFPIAHDVTSTQAIIRDNVASPVWAHSLVKLCHRQHLGRALNACREDTLCRYEDFSFADPIGHGDYCGFDFVLSQAQASLQARLQAIRQTGVPPGDYIQQLCQRVERSQVMQDAWTCLRGYPFSTLAMIGEIQDKLLPPGPEAETPLTATSPYSHFDACLAISEALLDEGVYRPVRDYLRRLAVLDQFVEQGLETDHAECEPYVVFSGALMIRYLLCLAHYYYLYDTSDSDPRYLPPRCTREVNREVLVQKAWITLQQAQRHVGLRLRKYVVLNEVSQGTFHPHYLLLSRIAFLRTKLMLFFPYQVPDARPYLPTDQFSGQQRRLVSIHWGRLYLAEKARLYAAADGNSEIYACYAAMQAWLYLMAAYAQVDSLNLQWPRDANSAGSPPLPLSPQDCFVWAQRLRDHALLTYADTGRNCYYQIKEKSGLPKNTLLDEFGSYRIEKIPPIYETRGSQFNQFIQTESELLVLDMSLLAVNPDDLPKLSPHHPTRTIYLFGTNACYLLFIRGLFMLCSNVNQEFDAASSDVASIDWDAKLLHAIRLLNTAWAIAEEGGHIDTEKQDGQRIFRILRSFHQEPDQRRFSAPEIDSIRDLYPRRIGEISDLGKVFAAAGMVLRLPLCSADQQARLHHDINALLASLHSAHSLEQSRTQRAILKRQRRYNGHLDQILCRVTEILHQAQHQPPDLPPWQRRDRLFTDLFAAFSEVRDE